MIALIDADIVLVRFACANQTKTTEFDETTGDPIETTEVNFEKACKDADSFLSNLKKTLWADSLLLCFSDSKKNNFRYKVLPSYKHNRIKKEPLQLWYPLREYLKANYTYNLMSNIEADDILGILQTTIKDDETIICTIDKDLDQIEGLHYNWGSRETYELSKIDGEHMFYRQVLSGDSGDGYSGCKGIGKVLAKKHLPEGEDILDEYEVWSRVVSVYEAKDLTEADAIITARLARILRGNEYNQKTGEVQLWEPLSK